MKRNATQSRETDAAMWDVHDVAEFLKCSPRHVLRLAEDEILPAPAKLGSLSRWPREQIVEWTKTGCKPVRQAEVSQ